MRTTIVFAMATLAIAGTARAQNTDWDAPANCYYAPSRFNTGRGDSVLVTDPHGGIIYQLLSSLGQIHSHSGMALSDNAIRHNTLYEGQIKTVDDTVPTRLKATGDRSLRDGSPGVIEQNAYLAAASGDFPINGVVLTSVPTDGEFSDSRAAQLNAAADNMSRFQGFYKLFAYTQLDWDDPFHATPGEGSACSGTIYHAHRLANNEGWSAINVRFYDKSIRYPAAELLFDKIKERVLDEPFGLESVVFALSGIGGLSLDEVGTRIGNQVVNCMAFNDCGNIQDGWRAGVNWGYSLSPDDIYNLALAHTLIAEGNNLDSNFAYNAVKPFEATSSYYCCGNACDGM